MQEKKQSDGPQFQMNGVEKLRKRPHWETESTGLFMPWRLL